MRTKHPHACAWHYRFCRFCSAHGIHKTHRLNSADLDAVVTDAIDKVKNMQFIKDLVDKIVFLCNDYMCTL